MLDDLNIPIMVVRMTEINRVPMLFVLDQPHPVLADRAPLGEGMVASIFDGLPCLTMIVDDPTPRELRLFRTEKAHLGIIKLDPHGYVWLLKLGRELFFEAPMAPMVEHETNRRLVDLPDHLHMPMHLHMIDTAGTIRAMRTFTLTPSFAGFLRGIHDASLSVPAFDQQEWQRSVDAYQARYESPLHAFAGADATVFGGIKHDPSMRERPRSS